MEPTLGLKSTHQWVRKRLGANACLRFLTKVSAKSRTLSHEFRGETKTPPKQFIILEPRFLRTVFFFEAYKPAHLAEGSLQTEADGMKPITCYNRPEKVSSVVGGPEHRGPEWIYISQALPKKDPHENTLCPGIAMAESPKQMMVVHPNPGQKGSPDHRDRGAPCLEEN